MKKSNLMVISLVVFMLAACGSSEDVDVDAVSSYIFLTWNHPNQNESMSEKDAKCLAKNLKKLVSDDLWNVRVRIDNGELSEDDLSLGHLIRMQPLWALVGKECGVKLF